eukprot:CAMPEP_0116096414 /NCGR_PEP_ID=MMETSP0327-20121206/10168_1 /TAXON_ID=44447 /ORGANISM="Pseudo-nitzschia delicatissima, Strain B596" /LENGTH=287 /DNA_ID=CAMNT_0003588115 /DNA_START=1 /DNA_END=866 /DNA_ORIENTATION=-
MFSTRSIVRKQFQSTSRLLQQESLSQNPTKSTMEKETKDTDDGIDDETVDLFALMNSSIMELQMELEILESREYERDDNNHNDQEIKSMRQNDISDSIKDTEIDKTPPIPLRSPINYQHNQAKTTSVDWQAMEPAKAGDQDYAPVSDYSPGKTVVVAGVRELESDRDYDDDESITEQQQLFALVTPAKVGDEDLFSEQQQLFAPVTPAKVGDEDYVPVVDFTKTANAETIANAIVKVTSKTKLRECEQMKSEKKNPGKRKPGKPKEVRIAVCGLFQEPESLGHFTRL